ncbi:ABC transporter ATP-binding protein [Streptomyces sp. SL13]|uniref:ABC transporter ATP-binding protein n=1 Tax=Streptantibioticus silvisoli TaxID=2705255 RepID=A0AA90H8S1_9ACTN|nr:ABC transporter ATP-binding protein [Streptantibioticus silvisoli]MDI5974001.1 ABC transporter ATP-binding protein [Streptantibioticus silvisoli]
MNETNSAALRTDALGRAFGRTWALRACDLEIPAGSVVLLAGPNGAGKSTLLHLTAGLLTPTTGHAQVLGRTPGTRDARARTALVAQDKPLHPGLTVAEQLRAGRELNSRWDQNAALAVLRTADIPPGTRVGRLSPGLRTRVALATALGRRPDLLLLDEPLADLDPPARHQVLGLLMADNAERGTTIVFSSHILHEAEQICDQVVLLRQGRVRLAGPAQPLCTAHTAVTGRTDRAGHLPAALTALPVVESSIIGRQFTALVRGPVPPEEPWLTRVPSLEELLLAHLHPTATTDSAAAPARGRDAA